MKTFNIAVALSTAVLVSAQSATEGDTTATPTGPVIQITYPGGVDEQIIVGSLIGTENQLTTVLIGCPDGTDSNDCGFNPPVTITAGPTTLRFALEELEGLPPYTQDCSFNSDGGICTITGPADITGTEDPPVETTTTSIAASDITNIAVTITAGETADLTSGSSGPGSTSAGNGGSGSGSGTSNTDNSAKALVPGSFGAMLLGLAAIYL